MTHTIEALWNGALAYCEHCGAHDPEANHLLVERAKLRERLWGELTEDQRTQLDTYLDRTERYTLRMMELAFRDGFSAGVRLLAEVLCEGWGIAGAAAPAIFAARMAGNMHCAAE